jgi:apolipoprotein N-acyltransferase
LSIGPRTLWRGTEPLAAAALGALQTLAFVHTSAWALPLLTLAWLAWRLGGAAPRRAALLGWCYGMAWMAAGVWWLFISLYRYGHLPAVLAAAAVLALAGTLGLFLALAAWGYARWRHGTAGDVALFTALWTLTELGRGLLLTGFPWLASGYAQVDSPLAALAPWLGVYGIGAVLAAAAAALARLGATRGRSWVPAAAVAAVVLAAGLAPSAFTQPAGEVTVALLQTNVAQDEKFAADHMPQTLAWVGRELLAAQADLVVAPETAVPLLPFQLEDFAPGYWNALREHFAAPGRAALVGLPLGDFERGYTNSVAGLAGAAAAPAYRYDKAHLVPFGEFIPTGFHWFTEMMDIPLGDFERGVANPPSFAAAGQRVAPNICYEDLFGEELARRFADPAAAPTLFANLSNIGWFGNTIAIAQHLNISRLRTLEFQRPMLRATNTGATAIIDHRGQVLAQLEPHTQGVLTGRVQGRQGVTPYAWWTARAALWPMVLGAALACMVLARRRPRP